MSLSREAILSPGGSLVLALTRPVKPRPVKPQSSESVHGDATQGISRKTRAFLALHTLAHSFSHCCLPGLLQPGGTDAVRRSLFLLVSDALDHRHSDYCGSGGFVKRVISQKLVLGGSSFRPLLLALGWLYRFR